MMAWLTAGVLILAALCSVLSADSFENEPYLKIVSVPMVHEVGIQKGLFCQGQHLPSDINWYTPSGELAVTNERMTVERKTRDGIRHAALIFQPIQLIDNGTWICKSGDYNQSILVTVGKRVVFNSTVEKREENETKTIKLKCEADGHPLPVVQWYKDGNLINDSVASKYAFKKNGVNYSLTIKNLAPEDTGEYQCKVTQEALSHYIEKNFHLNVSHPPKLNTEKLVETFGILNETKNLTCSAIAYPPATFSWTRTKPNSYKEDLHDGVYTSPELGESVLVLNLRNEDDVKMKYTCRIKNNMGSASVQFDISLGHKPATPDSITTLSCNGTALVFNVSCVDCIFEKPGYSTDPQRLPVIGFQFQLAPYIEDYNAEWDVAFEKRLDTTEDETYTVDGLSTNVTTYHVRVRSQNAAGYSDWFNATEPASTCDAARVIATTLALLPALFALLF